MALNALLRRSQQITKLLEDPLLQSCRVTACQSRVVGVAQALAPRSAGPEQARIRLASGTVQQSQEEIDGVNDLFAEARELIQDANDEAETVYFNEAHGEARDAVSKVLSRYYRILEDLSDGERGKLQRAMGLKIEQLKAELENLDNLHA